MKNINVDILKFLAAILVMFSHSFYLSANEMDYLGKFTNDYVNFGALAVSVFFAFSGYYITKSLVNKGDKKFFRKRLKRIIPCLAVVITLSVFVLGPICSELSILKYLLSKETYLYLINILLIPIHNLPGVFANNIFTSTINGSLWTLSVEVACYIFIYFVYKFNLLNKDRSFIYLGIGALLSLSGYFVFTKLNLLILINMIRPFLIFLVASIIYLIFNNKKIDNKLILFSLICFLLLLGFNSEITINLAFIVFVPILVIGSTQNLKQPSSKLGILGSISYPMYLLGFPIQQLIVNIFGGMMNPYLNFIYSIVPVILLALGLYYFVDKKIK